MLHADMAKRPTVSLVLGSGGARGLAHIGVIRWLNENGYRIQSVSGSSDPTFSRSGLFKGERVMGVLRELIGDCAIEELPMPFTAVATDLDSGEEVWLRDGKLFDAIRASIATHLRGAKRIEGLLAGLQASPVLRSARQGESAERGFIDIAMLSMQLMQDRSRASGAWRTCPT
jgi:hypothetical protein